MDPSTQAQPIPPIVGIDLDGVFQLLGRLDQSRQGADHSAHPTPLVVLPREAGQLHGRAQVGRLTHRRPEEAS
jgi:hypothetical protein